MPTLALATGSLHNYGLNRVWDFALEAGFDAVEVMIDTKWDSRQPTYLRSLVAATGLPIAALHTPFRPLVGFGEDYPACVRRALDLAGEVGAMSVVAHPELANGTDYSHWLMKHYEELSPTDGPTLAVENMPLVLVNRKPKYASYTIDRIAKFPGITLDTTHFATANVDILTAFEALRDEVRHIHLSDFGDGREHRVPGRGVLPLDLFLLALAEAQYERVITVELVPDALEAGDDDEVRTRLRETVAFCRANGPWGLA
ncbi:MAG TPA: TIM barrel protein [Thermomicrobiales bacterium]|jgi:sugar phosphate isomerase/epimerase